MDLPNTSCANNKACRTGERTLSYPGAPLVDPWCFAVVSPGVLKHEPNIITILPGICVRAIVKLTLYGSQIYRILYDVIIVLKTIARSSATGANEHIHSYSYTMYMLKKSDRKSTRLNSSHVKRSRMPSSAWKKKKNKNYYITSATVNMT